MFFECQIAKVSLKIMEGPVFRKIQALSEKEATLVLFSIK